MERRGRRDGNRLPLTPKGGCNAIERVATLPDGARFLLGRLRCAPKDGKANEAIRADHRRFDLAGI